MRNSSVGFWPSYTTLKASIELWRLDKPTGAILLLVPMLMALTAVPQASLGASLLLVVGVVSIRSCGCAINDICDRNFDAQVARTASRPLPSGRLSLPWAVMLAGLSGFFALLSVAWVPWSAYPMLALCAALIVLYPLSKRFFPFPQLILGFAFASSIPCVYAFFEQPWDGHAQQLTAIVIAWVISFDTSYALADWEDDQRLSLHALTKTLGYKSSLKLSQLLLAIVQIKITEMVLLAQAPGLRVLIPLACSWILTLYLIKIADQGRLSQQVFHLHPYLGLLWVLSLS